MLKRILLAFATLMGLVLVIGRALPSTYRVERSTVIHAPPEAILSSVASLRRWQDWAPWNAKRYPGSQWAFGEQEEGAGAVSSWSGEQVGSGTLRLTEADGTGVAYDLSVEHGRYLLHGRISLAPEGQGTRVTWVDEGSLGTNPFVHYLVPLIQSKLGGDLEQGLANLKMQVEANALPAATKPAPAPVVQAPAPSPPPASEPPAPAPAEGAQPVAQPAAGTQVAPSSAEGSKPAAPGEAAPTAATTPPAGERAPASTGTAAPAPTPAPAPTATTTPALQ